MTVTYLIHFDRPLEHATHYIGWSGRGTLLDRLNEHAAGRGARLLAVLNERGIGWRLARTWPGTGRDFERRLKKGDHGVRLCPLCSPGNRRMMNGRKRLVRPRLTFSTGGLA